MQRNVKGKLCRYYNKSPEKGETITDGNKDCILRKTALCNYLCSKTR
ncbi:MAG: hypothetical protein AB7F53_04720 [Nitrososphaeraceae archaeon]